MSQTAGDLRTLVVRRAGKGRRVAVLGSDAPLVARLQANGCTVLVDPDGAAALEAFQPDVVVGFDGLVQGGADGSAAFRMLAKAVPGAELVFSCANAGSAAALVAQLTGLPTPAGQSELDVRRWLEQAGYGVTARDVVVVPFKPTGLATDAEAALRALLEQVNPAAGADRWLWVCKVGAPVPQTTKVAGLLSVVVLGQGDRSAFERTAYSPKELVGSVEDARGQYLAFVRAGDVIYRDHWSRLVVALQRGLSAWAIESDVPVLQRLREGAVDCCAWVVDRDRLGPFALTLPVDAPAAEAVLFARLAAVFPATLVPGGPSYERAAKPAPVSDAIVAMQARPLRLLLALTEALTEKPHAPPQLRDALKAKLSDLLREK